MKTALAEANKIKFKLRIIKECPIARLDDVAWYDTTDFDLTKEKFYLSMVGVLIYHPVNCALVRFKEAKVEQSPPPVSDPRRVLRPYRNRS